MIILLKLEAMKMNKTLLKFVSIFICLITLLSLCGCKKSKEPTPILYASDMKPFGPWIGIGHHYIIYDNGRKEKIPNYNYNLSTLMLSYNTSTEMKDEFYVEGDVVTEEEITELKKIGKSVLKLSQKNNIEPSYLCKVGEKYYFSGTEKRWFKFRDAVYEYDFENNSIKTFCKFKYDMISIEPYLGNEMQPTFYVTTSKQFAVKSNSKSYYIVYDNGKKEKTSKYELKESEYKHFTFRKRNNDTEPYLKNVDAPSEYDDIAKVISNSIDREEIALRQKITPKELYIIGEDYYISCSKKGLLKNKGVIYKYDKYEHFEKMCEFKNEITDFEPYYEIEE